MYCCVFLVTWLLILSFLTLCHVHKSRYSPCYSCVSNLCRWFVCLPFYLPYHLNTLFSWQIASLLTSLSNVVSRKSRLLTFILIECTIYLSVPAKKSKLLASSLYLNSVCLFRNIHVLRMCDSVSVFVGFCLWRTAADMAPPPPVQVWLSWLCVLFSEHTYVTWSVHH